jgi:hypothetical protein
MGKGVQHATDLDGLIVTTIDHAVATRYEHWCGKLPKWTKHLKTWGEAGTVKTKTDTTPKLADRGITCMFVGFQRIMMVIAMLCGNRRQTRYTQQEM